MAPRPTASPALRAHPRRVAAVVLGALAVVAVVATTGGTARAQGVDPSTTTVPSGGGSSTPTSPSPSAGVATPSGQVAYVTADGRVWVGDGAKAPVEVGQGAAIGRAGQAGVVVSPNADAVAFIRADHSLVTVPIGGGPPTVLATDAVTSSLGRDPSLAWNPLGDEIAYLAAGTPEMVAPRSSEPKPLSGPGVYRVPLPEGVIGNVVKVVDRTAALRTRIGDPSVRSYVGITWSPADDLMLLESVIPGTTRRYTVVASSGSGTETPTLLSMDDPTFSPDGRFILGVGPAKGSRELVRVSSDSLDRTTLVTDDSICNPSVSPDSTRIVYGAGRNCSRLMVISSKGGRPVDVTPADATDTTTYGVGQIGWTTEGRFVTHPDCRNDAGRLTCDGPVMFLNPDTGRVDEGPVATTVAPIVRALIQDVFVDVDLRGPLKFRHSFVIDQSVQGTLTDTGANGGQLQGRLVDGATVMDVKLQVKGGSPFVTGQITVTDPTAGIDRTFLVLGRATVLGVRIFSLTGIWMTTEDLPFATGKFNLAVRRR